MAEETGKDLVEQLAAQLLSSKIQARHILNYNGANLAYTHALDMATKLGLSPEEKARITPFPAPSYNIQLAPGADASAESNASQASPSLAERATKWLAPAIVGASLLGGGQLLQGYLSQSPAAAPTPPPASDQSGNLGFTVE